MPPEFSVCQWSINKDNKYSKSTAQQIFREDLFWPDDWERENRNTW